MHNIDLSQIVKTQMLDWVHLLFLCWMPVDSTWSPAATPQRDLKESLLMVHRSELTVFARWSCLERLSDSDSWFQSSSSYCTESKSKPFLRNFSQTPKVPEKQIQYSQHVFAVCWSLRAACATGAVGRTVDCNEKVARRSFARSYLLIAHTEDDVSRSK